MWLTSDICCLEMIFIVIMQNSLAKCSWVISQSVIRSYKMKQMISIFYPILLFSYLTHYGLVMSCGEIYMGQHCSGNGLLSDSTKPLPESMFTYYHITRIASWGPDRRKWLFSEVRGGIWTPHSPVLIKISADKRPLNQLTVKNLFFSLIIKTFCH